MTLYLHELRRGRNSLIIWTAVVAGMILVCMLMFPEMSSQAAQINDMFADMGTFTTAFGMDRISMAEPMGFYGIECGNMLGIGGSFFAALLGIAALAREETDRTAEFLFSHPVKRSFAVWTKLCSVYTQIIVFNVLCAAVSVASFVIIGETPAWDAFLLFHAAQLILHLEITSLCFGISAFVRRGAAGIGIGLAALMYFLSLVCNISEKADFLRYITPFKYAEAADVIADVTLDLPLILIGTVAALVFVAAGAWHYVKKNLAA